MTKSHNQDDNKDDSLPLRRIKDDDENTNKTFNLLSNNSNISAQTIADLYRHHLLQAE